MTRSHVLEVIGFVICLWLIYEAPDIALTTIVLSLPVIAVLTGLSVIYLRRIYLRQPVPRSRFFAMLVGISSRTWIGALWIGYLTMSRIGERTGWYSLPNVNTNVSSPISGLVVAYLMTPPIFYAFNVWRVRRRVPGATTIEDDNTLDRVDASSTDVPHSR